MSETLPCVPPALCHDLSHAINVLMLLLWIAYKRSITAPISPKLHLLEDLWSIRAVIHIALSYMRGDIKRCKITSSIT